MLEDAAKQGFVSARIDGEMRELAAESAAEYKLESRRSIASRSGGPPQAYDEDRKRLAESVETAFEIAEGTVIALREPAGGGAPCRGVFLAKGACPECGISLPEMEPRLFSFNAPQGACPVCSGLGQKLQFDPDLVIPDGSLSFNEGAASPTIPRRPGTAAASRLLPSISSSASIRPSRKLPKRVLTRSSTDRRSRQLEYENREGTGASSTSRASRGSSPNSKRRYLETQSDGIKQWLERFMSEKPCDACDGKRLRPEALAVTVGGIGINDFP